MKRRVFLNGLGLGAAGLLGVSALGRPGGWRKTFSNKAPIQTRNSARNLIFILLEGGASHVDTFDLKTGFQTPDFLGAQDLGGFLWPSGIMPELAQIKESFSIVRSISAIEPVHERAVYHLTTAQRHDPSRIDEIPAFLSAMSYKLADQRRAGDSLPTTVLFGDTMAGNGFFPIEHRGLGLNVDGGIENLNHQAWEGESRFQLLNNLLAEVEGSDQRAERVKIQNQAQTLMNDSDLQNLLGLGEEIPDTPDSYSAKGVFLRQCKAASRLLEADKGARVVRMTLGGWDHHDNIYAQGEDSLASLAGALDAGLAWLINNLKSKPAKTGNGTLLDETLIVAAGEFGRTTGPLNLQNGRDHYPPAMSAFFAGGGVKSGRIIGKTDATGANIMDPGWSHNRFMGIGDLVATMYSALGIDWSERFLDTPSGRLYELTPSLSGTVYDIDSLFV